MLIFLDFGWVSLLLDQYYWCKVYSRLRNCDFMTTIHLIEIHNFICYTFFDVESLATLDGSTASCQYNIGKSTDNLSSFCHQQPPSNHVLKFFNNPGHDTTTVNIPISIGSFVALAPNAVLNVDKSVVSTCSKISVDASSSTSLDRRALIFTWPVESAPTTESKDVIVDKMKQACGRICYE